MIRYYRGHRVSAEILAVPIAYLYIIYMRNHHRGIMARNACEKKDCNGTG